MILEDLCDYIEAETALVYDSTLLIGALESKIKGSCVVVQEFAGGFENWSGMIQHPIMVQAQDLTYLLAKTLIYTVYDLLQNKAGFDDTALSDVLFCEVLNRPFPLGQSPAGLFLFSMNFLLRMK